MHKKNLILSFIHSNYKTSAFLTLFLDKFLKSFTRKSCRLRGQKSGESGVALMFFSLTADYQIYLKGKLLFLSYIFDSIIHIVEGYDLVGQQPHFFY